MKIKKFNESNSLDNHVYLVYISYDGGISEEESICFDREILAADYLIKWINKIYGKNFEPFFEEDGTRLFLNISDNPDYQKCIEFKWGIDYYIKIIKIPVLRKNVDG